jgi:hypothetical protein
MDYFVIIQGTMHGAIHILIFLPALQLMEQIAIILSKDGIIHMTEPMLLLCLHKSKILS